MADLPEDKTLGKYRLESCLGEGGMGIVYAAFDTVLKRRVAIKILPDSLASDTVAAKRFLQEAQAAARLNHPNAVTVHEIARCGKTIYIAMELVAGVNAADYLCKSGRLPFREATRITAEACRALVAAHAAGLLHRDVKPSNLILGSDGRIKLADFGLSKILGERSLTLSNAQGTLGTPAYMSPEQCQCDEVSDLSDVYSLGATYFALLTAKPPYDSENAVQVMFSHCSAPIPDPRQADASIPVACAQIVRQAMEKRPENRFRSAATMLASLEKVLADHTESIATTSTSVIVLTEPASTGHRMIRSRSRTVRRRLSIRWLIAGLLFVASLVLGGVEVRRRQQIASNEHSALSAKETVNVPPPAESAVESNDRAEGAAVPPQDKSEDIGSGIASRSDRGANGDSFFTMDAAAAAVAFMPDNRVLFVGEMDSAGTLSFVDVQTGEIRQQMNSIDWNPNPLSGSPSGLTGVLSIAVSPNGTQLAVGIDGPSHGLWLLQQDRQNTWRVTSRKSPGLPRACQFSPLDNLFAAAYQEIRFRQEPLEIWTVDLQNKIPLAGSNDTWLTAISFANRRKETLVVADQQGEVRFLDCTSGRVTQTISTGIAVSCLAISLQDRRMAVVGDGRLQLWNLVVTPPAFRTVSVNARDAVFTPDGRWLITAGSQQTESEIAVWLVDEVRQIRTLKGHSGPVRKLALTRDGSMLASAGEDETVRLWRLLP